MLCDTTNYLFIIIYFQKRTNQCTSNITVQKKITINYETSNNLIDKLSVDNLSVVFIGLDGMEKYIMHQKNKEIKNELKKK